MEIKVVGGSCGQHGSCTFFKGLRVVLPTTTINNNNNTTSTTTLTTVATSRLSLNNNNANNKQNNSIKSKDCNNKTLNNSTNGNNLNGKRGAGISSSVSSDVSDNDNKVLNGNESCESNKISEVITCDKSNEMKREPLESKEVEENTSSSNSKSLILALGDCIPVRPWSDSPIECLAEIRMIWKDKTEQCLLISLRLYFLPENTPLGRNCHGEDELVAVNEKVILRADDFSSWVVGDLKWNWGLVASFNGKPTVKLITSSNGLTAKSLLSNTKLDFSEVEKEKTSVENIHTNVTVLSFSRYCRYRATLKRLEGVEDQYIRTKLIETLSGFVASQPNTRIMFCKESIDYPDLESHEMLCLHLAPKLKGRPRGRRKKVNQISECSSPPPSSEYSVDSCETNDSDAFSEKRGVSGTPGKKETKKEKELRGNQRVTRTKTKSESSTNKENQINEKLLYTTLSTGRVTKQRMQITPSKSTTTKKRAKNNAVSDEEDESSDDEDDNDEDEDYDDKYINRKLKQESGGTGSGTKRQNSSNSGNEDKIKIEKDQPKSVSISPISQQIPINLDIIRSIEEQEFMARLNKFMSERAYAYPKLIWSLRDVNLYTIYARVQKLGGFDKIADNRVWKNLFEDLVAPNGGSVAQGMTKRKYERILLPFERYERELRNHFDSNHSEITISTVSKSYGMNGSTQGHSIQIKQRSNSPAIEIIPIKNGNGSENHELTKEQMNEIQNIIKHKDNTVSYHSLNGNSNDGISVPVTVIVRPQANNNNNHNNNNSGDDQNNTLRSKYNENGADGRAFVGLEAEHYYNNKLLRHSRGKQDRRIPYSPNSPRNSTNSPQQAPSEKENIPMMLSKQSTTIVPLNRDGMPASGFGSDVIELVDSDDDSGRAGSSMRTSGPMKKRKLDILREGGLEVTPISRGQMENLLMMIPSGMQGEQQQQQQNQHPKISMTTLPPRAAPPVKFQSMNMYQTTTKIFGNPKDFMPITTMKPVGNYQPPTTSRDCLDLTVSPTRKRTLAQAGIQLPEHLSIVEKRKPTLEEMQRSYRGGNPDLQITLVKAQQYRPNGVQPGNSGITQPKRYQPKNASEKKSKASSTTQSSIPPLNPTLIAAANELQKRNMLPKSLMFPTNSFLPGIDITPSHSMASHLPQSAATSTTMASKMQAPKMNHHVNSTPPPQTGSVVPSSFLSLLDPIYLSALYAANPSFLNFQNSLPPELLKFYQNSIPAQSIPSSKS